MSVPVLTSNQTPPNDTIDLPALTNVLTNILAPTLAQLSGKSKKRSSSDPADQENQDPNGSTIKDYKYFGRVLSRQIEPFSSIDAMVNFGIKRDSADDEEESATLSERQLIDRFSDQGLLHGWETICNTIPGFRDDMLKLAEKRKVRKLTCQQIQDGVLAVRSDDRNAVKVKIPNLIMLNKGEPLVPPVGDTKKNDRGYAHPMIAALLCPVKYEAKTETYESIRAHTLRVTAAMLPRFLFPDGHIHDPNDMLRNVLCGHLIQRVAKLIFQGPSTALDEPGAHRGKQGNAALCGLTSMTPHTIAYVVVQTHFAMTSASTWSTVVGTFNYEDFYWKIVGLFKDDVESKEMLKFFNHHVFGTAEPSTLGQDWNDEDEDDFEVAMRQRAAKRARTVADMS